MRPAFTVRLSHFRKRSRLFTAFLIGLLSAAAGCSRQIKVTEQMTWECAPEHYMSQYPEAQPVRFRFVEDPQFEEVVSGRGLCDQLKASGKKIVAVEYETWGDSSSGLIGFREIAVDGQPIVTVGGWGSSGSHIQGGQHPLEKLYKPRRR